MPNTPNLVYMRLLYCCKDNFHFQVHCYCSQKGVNRLKTLTLQGLFPYPLSLPSFPSPPLSSDLSLPSKELLRGPLKGGRPGLTVTMTKLWLTIMRSNGGLCAEAHMVKPAMESGLELRTPPSWKEELVAHNDGHGDHVHNDIGWMGPPGKAEMVAQDDGHVDLEQFSAM